MKNKFKLLLATALIGATVVGATLFAINEPHFDQPVQAVAQTYSCTRPLFEGYVYNSNKKGFIYDGTSTTSPTFTWVDDYTQFTISVNDQYLKYSKGDLSLGASPTYWSAKKVNNNIVIQSGDSTRALLWRKSNSYDIIKHYALRNIGDEYHTFTFWDADDMTQWNDWGCAATNVFGALCLGYLINPTN